VGILTLLILLYYNITEKLELKIHQKRISHLRPNQIVPEYILSKIYKNDYKTTQELIEAHLNSSQLESLTKHAETITLTNLTTPIQIGRSVEAQIEREEKFFRKLIAKCSEIRFFCVRVGLKSEFSEELIKELLRECPQRDLKEEDLKLVFEGPYSLDFFHGNFKDYFTL
jgi:hypothetical protein